MVPGPCMAELLVENCAVGKEKTWKDFPWLNVALARARICCSTQTIYNTVHTINNVPKEGSRGFIAC